MVNSHQPSPLYISSLVQTPTISSNIHSSALVLAKTTTNIPNIQPPPHISTPPERPIITTNIPATSNIIAQAPPLAPGGSCNSILNPAHPLAPPPNPQAKPPTSESITLTKAKPIVHSTNDAHAAESYAHDCLDGGQTAQAPVLS
ncbi:hypothetical protein LIER_32000 [Lithospermum erythrorhizon]|uniref:Uncharacterized protein n=1 Tax=Lithospermum erythrorhizon TaxID=34254 RepID=A0AAV3RWM4_LITER